MSLKQIRADYFAKNNEIGLSDVKGQIYLNGVAKAVGGSALSFTELDSTNAKGVYVLTISPSTLAGYGAVAGDKIRIYADSASKHAPAEANFDVTESSFDDLETHLALQDVAIAAIKSELDDSSFGLAALKSELDTISSQISGIQSNTDFEMIIPEAGFIKPASGSQIYRIPIAVKSAGSRIDPDSDTILVDVKNPAGTSRTSMLVGYVSGPVTAVQDVPGKYHIDISIASNSVEEELIFSADYDVASVAKSWYRVGNVVNNVQADGFALESTLLDVQTTVDGIDTKVSDVQTKINDGVYGLEAANALQADIKTQTDKLGDGTIGLLALKTYLADIQTYLNANVYSGGKIV